MPVLGFIGTGNMGGALARAAAKRKDSRLLLTNRTQAKAERLAAELGAEAVSREQAASRVAGGLEVLSDRLAVIPTEGRGVLRPHKVLEQKR